LNYEGISALECAPIITQHELFDKIIENVQLLQAWNTELQDFFAQERKPALFDVIL